MQLEHKNKGKSSATLKVCWYLELTLQWNWKTGNFLLEQPSYKSYKPLKLCNRSCLFRKLKCLFKAACTYMKNSDHNRIPYFISCFANQLSILDKNKCWFTHWTLLKTFQTEANTTTNVKYERQTKQTSKKKKKKALKTLHLLLKISHAESGVILEPCFDYC